MMRAERAVVGEGTPAEDGYRGRDTEPDADEPSSRDTYVDENELGEPDPPNATSHERLVDGAATETGAGAVSDLDGYRLPAEGDVIDDRYVIARELGRGASGVVYEARHRAIGRRLAIKCLHPQMSTLPVAVQRLFREARITASLKHPNVIEVYDAGRDGDRYYLAMELLEGEPLSEHLARGPHAPDTIARIFLGIMDGVAAVQQLGVVHRDLKPDNVFLLPDAGGLRPKVLDFGVSKLFEPGRQQITTHGMTMGTPFYMAPEQVTDSGSVDARADVYSLGVMLYEALAGEVPYPGDSMLEIFGKCVQGRPAPLRERRPDAPPALEVLVARAMCPDAAGRFESVHAMREALA